MFITDSSHQAASTATTTYYHMPRSFDPLVATLPLLDQSKTANIYQMPLVTLPPSHSHHVIRMDPATHLKNGAVLLVIT